MFWAGLLVRQSLGSTILRTAQPSEPGAKPADLVSDLGAATMVSLLSARRVTGSLCVEKPDLLVTTDPHAVQQPVRELATDDLTAGVVLPELEGPSLTFLASEGAYAGSVSVLTSRWVQSYWGSGALLAEALSLLRDEASDLHQHLYAKSALPSVCRFGVDLCVTVEAVLRDPEN